MPKSCTSLPALPPGPIGFKGYSLAAASATRSSPKPAGTVTAGNFRPVSGVAEAVLCEAARRFSHKKGQLSGAEGWPFWCAALGAYGAGAIAAVARRGRLKR